MHGIMQNERLKGDMANMGPTSPTSPSFGSFSNHASNTNAGSDPNPFNFQPMALAKSPVMKSVWYTRMRRIVLWKLIGVTGRISVSDVVTNTSIVVFRIRSFWNHHLELR